MKRTEMTIGHSGRNISAVLYEPASAPYPLVIMSHGYNGHYSDFESSAEYFSENGVGVFCYTFCGGSVRDISGFPSTSMTLFSEMEDLYAVLNKARQLELVDKDHIFLFGGSQGGLVSAMAASKKAKECINALILLYPAFCIPADWNIRFPTQEDIPDSTDFWGLRLGKEFFLSLRDPKPFEDIYSFNKPVLILQGDSDSVATLENSQKVAETYPNARLEVFAGEKHGFSEAGTHRMEAMTLYFMRSCIFNNSI